MVPGAMFSIVTSALASSALTISSPRGDFKFTVSDFLFALNWWKYHGSSSGLPGRKRRPGSPVSGFSILTTSAPSQASDSVHDGPASNWVKSTTLMPARQSISTPSSAISDPPKGCCRNDSASRGRAETALESLSASRPVGRSEAKVDERIEAVRRQQQRRIGEVDGREAKLRDHDAGAVEAESRQTIERRERKEETRCEIADDVGRKVG